MSLKNEFKNKLTKLLNATSQENASNTPDYILAEYLISCLKAYSIAVSERDSKHPVPIETSV